MTGLAIVPQSNSLTVLDKAPKDTHSRVKIYNAWIEATGRKVDSPDMTAFRDYLLNDYESRNGKPLSPASAKAYLATVRSVYGGLLEDNQFRDYLYSMTPADASPADKAAFVNEATVRLKNAISPQQAKVKVITSQDTADSKHLWLKKGQVKRLLGSISRQDLIGLRDYALVALMTATGVREMEAAALEVKDLRQRKEGELSLHVREGKGAKERMIPYGDMEHVLTDAVDVWLENAGITEGKVFRGIYKGGKRVRPTGLTTRSINRILEKYPVSIDGEKRIVKPHDLRRTYARLLHRSGMHILYIRLNLGHASIETTKTYIGDDEFDERKPTALFDLPHMAAGLLV